MSDNQQGQGNKPPAFNVGRLLGKAFSAVEQAVSYWWCGALTIFLMFFISSEIIGRFLFNHSFFGIVDIVTLCLTVLAFATLSGVQRDRSHIRMDAVPDKLSGRRAGPIVECIILLLMLGVAAVLGYAVVRQAASAFRVGYVTPSIRLPVWPAAVFMPIGVLLLCIRLGIQIRELLASIIHRD